MSLRSTPPAPHPACTSSTISSLDKCLFRSTATILNSNYSAGPSSLVPSPNALPFLPCEKMCCEAYKGPQCWLNHLFRTHQLQGLVAMLTSFSDAPGAPWQSCVCPRCQPDRGGAERSSHPCHWALLSQHITSAASLVLLLSLPGSTSGLRLLPNAGIRKQG